MPEINFELATSGAQIPSLDGRIFCSKRDPKKEAQVWYHSQIPFLKGANQILILGLGAGFHLQKILQSEFLPEQVIVVENHQELVDQWIKQNGTEFADRVGKIQFVVGNAPLTEDQIQKSLTLEFRPAWFGNENFYQDLSNRLRKPSIKEVVSHLSIHDQSKHAKIWRALQELVR